MASLRQAVKGLASDNAQLRRELSELSAHARGMIGKLHEQMAQLLLQMRDSNWGPGGGGQQQQQQEAQQTGQPHPSRYAGCACVADRLNGRGSTITSEFDMCTVANTGNAVLNRQLRMNILHATAKSSRLACMSPNLAW